MFTDRPGALSNDFFRNVVDMDMDMDMEWRPVSDEEEEFELRDRRTGEVKWTATRVALLSLCRSHADGASP